VRKNDKTENKNKNKMRRHRRKYEITAKEAVGRKNEDRKTDRHKDTESQTD
jgi:hypothetical protein